MKPRAWRRVSVNSKGAGVRLRDQAVLCRTNGRLNEIASALEVRGIPVLHAVSPVSALARHPRPCWSSDVFLFEREEVRDLLAVLSLAVDPFGDALVRVGAMPRYGLTLQDAHSVSRFLRSLRKPALAGLANAVTSTRPVDIGTPRRRAPCRRSERPVLKCQRLGVSRHLSPRSYGPDQGVGPCHVRNGAHACCGSLAIPQLCARAEPGGDGTSDTAHP